MARLRWEVENEIERLVALLDTIDGDPDLKLTGDDGEPSDNGLTDEGALQEQLFLRPARSDTGSATMVTGHEQGCRRKGPCRTGE